MIGQKRVHVGLCLSVLFAAQAHSAVILQYHHVSETLPPVTSLPATTFKQHLDYLKNNKFNVIGLDTLLNTLKNGDALPDKTVAITFDDGYLNNFETAAPLLKQFSFPYTIFVNPQLIDENKSYVMNWQQLKLLAREGALIASHHLNHDYLHELREGESQEQWRVRLKQELALAQSRIATEIGHDLPWVAYPYGEYNREVQTIVSELGLVGIGQQSGAVGETTDWTAVPRFPASGVYANLETLRVKLSSKPFPLAKVGYEDTVTTQRQPKLTITFKEKSFHQSQFACYVTGQDLADIKWIDKTTVEVSAKKPLKNGRSRYNCTAPTKQDPSRYFWYSQQWLVKSTGSSPSP